MDSKTLLIGADFSIAKPALSLYFNHKLYFATFPQKVDNYTETALLNAGVDVYNRNLDTVDTKAEDYIYQTTKRYTDLGLQIWDYINTYDFNTCIFASEGLSYASRGNVTLELSGAKYVLLSTLYNHKIKDFYTFSPITIKSTAGCAKKGMGKEDMINAFKKETPLNAFMEMMQNDDSVFRKKSAYIHTIDDIVDSYWCLKTLCKKIEVEL